MTQQVKEPMLLLLWFMLAPGSGWWPLSPRPHDPLRKTSSAHHWVFAGGRDFSLIVILEMLSSFKENSNLAR